MGDRGIDDHRAEHRKPHRDPKQWRCQSAGCKGIVATNRAVPGPLEPPVASPLSARETEILQLLSKGLSYAEIGELLGISAHTVTQHIICLTCEA